MNRAFTNKIKQEVLEAIKPLEAKHNVQFGFKGGTIGNDSASLKLEVATVSRDGVVKTGEYSEFQVLAKFYGFEETDFGKEFLSNGTKYRISGLKSRRKKFPISATRVSDGATFKFATETVLRALGKEVK